LKWKLLRNSGNNRITSLLKENRFLSTEEPSYRRLTSYELKRMSKSKYIKYDKDVGLWIQHRKTVYLYWWKFLQHAEKDENFQVDWSKYQSWGGRELVMNSKFDDWWNDYWMDCFGFPEKQPRLAKYHTKRKPKIDAMRSYLFTYEQRHMSNWDIAVWIYEYENERIKKYTKRLRNPHVEMMKNTFWGLFKRYDEHEEFGDFDPNLETTPTDQERKKGVSRWRKNPRRRKKTVRDLETFKDGILTPETSEGWKIMYKGDEDYWSWEDAQSELTQRRKLKKHHIKQIDKCRKEYEILMGSICNGSLDPK